MADVHDVANYFLSLSNDEDSGDLISNLKLQKLVYYAQGIHLAVYGEPLFDDPIEAWTHGPVVPSLYFEYREFGSGPIQASEDAGFESLTPDQQELLDEVWSVYGQFSAWKLRNMTHAEAPWKNATEKSQKTITHAALTEYFKEQLA